MKNSGETRFTKTSQRSQPLQTKAGFDQTFYIEFTLNSLLKKIELLIQLHRRKHAGNKIRTLEFVLHKNS
ncbi:hypothetical protein LBK6_13400 [Leptospira borgpetersenii serovar Hardjo]|uniref:Uncharacterized protein n=1 Tax=Leptospira borgpetersenii serovar Pomona str. 200901868 TaxID=1192866 RepID=M6W765_LEPBO|nr:hypothetical protein LBK6_13400 [Leptospira borgpetersenii serovar Hardjo]AWV71021.1 hypothetical protein B9T54_14355 [Leptospira borgpetersenii serovar Hardjo-bovis]EMO63316.1 hypothetical protein LEP1GSC133_2183 [Leptospira borgpetersenii serovar Pomona str. 200901868]TQE51945.1 hypothetical protein FFZ95_12245 [Leptospira borgpetersenii]AMX62513.1 hypothetical protein LBK9_13310 [Leptospira borgpetersenii serovar Hardjo]